MRQDITAATLGLGSLHVPARDHRHRVGHWGPVTSKVCHGCQAAFRTHFSKTLYCSQHCMLEHQKFQGRIRNPVQTIARLPLSEMRTCPTCGKQQIARFFVTIRKLGIMVCGQQCRETMIANGQAG